MMPIIKRLRERLHDRTIIHCDGVDGNDYTLCGYATEGEQSGWNGGGLPVESVTRGKISCDQCLRIIRFAKQVPSRFLAKG